MSKEKPVPFITFGTELPGHPEPLGPTGSLVTWSVWDSSGVAIATGLDRPTALLFAAAPAIRDSLRGALEYMPRKARFEAEAVLAMVDGVTPTSDTRKK